jgi:hypothetical protein
LLRDIATLTAGQVISEEWARSSCDHVNDLGQARRSFD